MFLRYIQETEIYFGQDLLIEAIEKEDSQENMIKLTYVAKELWKYGEEGIGEIPVLTIDGEVLDSSKCYLPPIYEPNENWMKWKNLEDFDIGPFISEDYAKYDQDVEGWREFFKATGAKDYEDRPEVIGRFAEAFAKDKLKTVGL